MAGCSREKATVTGLCRPNVAVAMTTGQQSAPAILGKRETMYHGRCQFRKALSQQHSIRQYRDKLMLLLAAENWWGIFILRIQCATPLSGIVCHKLAKTLVPALCRRGTLISAWRPPETDGNQPCIYAHSGCHQRPGNPSWQYIAAVHDTNPLWL